MKRKTILLLTSRLPYPPIGGDKLKNYYLVKILSKHYDINLVTMTDEVLDEETKSFLDQHVKEYKIFTKTKFAFARNIVRTIFNSFPLQVDYYYFSDVQRYISQISKDVDLVLATLIRTSRYGINLQKPKIFDMADSLGQNYQRSISNVESLLWKYIYKYESKHMLAYESYTIKNYDMTFMFNQKEIDYFDMPNKIKLIPHGVNEELLQYSQKTDGYQNCVVFFGKMDYQPNVDAVVWFCENVLNKLSPHITFLIVGARPSEKVLSLKDQYPNMQITGFVDDPYLILNSCCCVIAPMQTGAGIQNKVLESMALGTINILSSLAALPIGGMHQREYLIVDNPVDMANQINDVFNCREKYELLKQNSREYIRKNFTWSIYEEAYIKEIEGVLNGYKK